MNIIFSIKIISNATKYHTEYRTLYKIPVE